MIHKIRLLFNIFYYLLLFKIQLRQKSFTSCLDKCQKKGFVKSEKDVQFADKILRKSLNTFHLKPGCLLHTLVLARIMDLQPQIYLQFETSDPFQSHAFIKWNQKYYSTSFLEDPKYALQIWGKEC